MNYYDEELQRLQQEMMEKERADAKLADLYIQQNELEKKAAEFRKIMEEEQEDVERLKRTNLTALFYRASGKMEEKLSKEEEEALAAVVKYDSAEKELQAVEEDIAYYEKQASGLPDCKIQYERMLEAKKEEIKIQYERMLEAKKEEIKESGNIEAGKILEMERQIAAIENRRKEVKEAISAGERARSIAEETLEGLQSAKNWGMVDLIGGGIMSDVIKYDKLKSVKDRTSALQMALRTFRTELSDVSSRIEGPLQVEVGEFLHFADYFFDGIFTDWMVYDKIKVSKERAEQTYSQIQGILEQLRKMQEQLHTEEEQKRRELEQIVLKG